MVGPDVSTVVLRLVTVIRDRRATDGLVPFHSRREMPFVNVNHRVCDRVDDISVPDAGSVRSLYHIADSSKD